MNDENQKFINSIEIKNFLFNNNEDCEIKSEKTENNYKRLFKDRIPLFKKLISEKFFSNNDYYTNDIDFEDINDYVDDFTTYIHCKGCFTLIAGQNLYIDERTVKNKIVVDHVFHNNIFLKEDNYNFKEEVLIVFCNICSSFIGVKDKDECFSIYPKKVFLKYKKLIKIGLFSLKADKLEMIETLFKNKYTLNSSKQPNIEIIKYKQTKDNLINFNFNEYLDFAIIIHKIEGRTFLLGRNGYYNKISECLYNKLKGNIFFFLIFKYTDDKDKLEYINSLITKGDQKELLLYQNENKLILFNEENLEEEFKSDSILPINILFKQYILENNEITSPEIINFTKDEKNFINDVLFKAENKIKCFIL